MPKKEFNCLDCDATFNIKFDKGQEVKYCPFCGSDLEDQESNSYEDDED